MSKLAALFGTVVLVTITACSSEVEGEDEGVDAVEAEEQSSAQSTEPCVSSPPPGLLGSCQSWQRNFMQSWNCPWGKGRGWSRWNVTGCRPPGAPFSVCENGRLRRMSAEESRNPAPYCRR